MDHYAHFNYSAIYHVYNRTNNKERLFRNDENRAYFIRRYQFYMSGFVNTYSYALLDNHFHFSISIKTEEEIVDFINKCDEEFKSKKMQAFLDSKTRHQLVDELIYAQFRRFFISYAQAFNRQNNRKGNLFTRSFKRVLVDADHKFAYNQYYIHHNARKHGMVRDFQDYPYHSFYELVSDEETFLDRDFVFEWFGGREAFIKFHKERHYESVFQDIYIEE